MEHSSELQSIVSVTWRNSGVYTRPHLDSLAKTATKGKTTNRIYLEHWVAPQGQLCTSIILWQLLLYKVKQILFIKNALIFCKALLFIEQHSTSLK